MKHKSLSYSECAAIGDIETHVFIDAIIGLLTFAPDYNVISLPLETLAWTNFQKQCMLQEYLNLIKDTASAKSN